MSQKMVNYSVRKDGQAFAMYPFVVEGFCPCCSAMKDWANFKTEEAANEYALWKNGGG